MSTAAQRQNKEESTPSDDESVKLRQLNAELEEHAAGFNPEVATEAEKTEFYRVRNAIYSRIKYRRRNRLLNRLQRQKERLEKDNSQLRKSIAELETLLRMAQVMVEHNVVLVGTEEVSGQQPTNEIAANNPPAPLLALPQQPDVGRMHETEDQHHTSEQLTQALTSSLLAAILPPAVNDEVVTATPQAVPKAVSLPALQGDNPLEYLQEMALDLVKSPLSVNTGVHGAMELSVELLLVEVLQLELQRHNFNRLRTPLHFVLVREAVSKLLKLVVAVQESPLIDARVLQELSMVRTCVDAVKEMHEKLESG